VQLRPHLIQVDIVADCLQFPADAALHQEGLVPAVALTGESLPMFEPAPAGILPQLFITFGCAQAVNQQKEEYDICRKGDNS
jgi:hypothetical protein